MRKINIIIFTFLVSFLFFYFKHLNSDNYIKTNKQPQTKIDSLNYTNTQGEIASFFEVSIKNKVNYLPADWESKIKLQAPEKNSSTSTTKELEGLHKLVLLRDKETVYKINKEETMSGIRLCDISIIDFLRHDNVKISSFFNNFSDDLTHVVITEKILFNRVRPSLLDPTLSTVLDVPKHPSYPSGHATQMYVYALLFSEFFPERKEDFMICASEISKRREIAGLHYESDSKAGEILANKFYSLIRPNILSEIKILTPTIRKEIIKI